MNRELHRELLDARQTLLHNEDIVEALGMFLISFAGPNIDLEFNVQPSIPIDEPHHMAAALQRESSDAVSDTESVMSAGSWADSSEGKPRSADVISLKESVSDWGYESDVSTTSNIKHEFNANLDEDFANYHRWKLWYDKHSPRGKYYKPSISDSDSYYSDASELEHERSALYRKKHLRSEDDGASMTSASSDDTQSVYSDTSNTSSIASNEGSVSRRDSRHVRQDRRKKHCHLPDVGMLRRNKRWKTTDGTQSEHLEHTRIDISRPSSPTVEGGKTFDTESIASNVSSVSNSNSQHVRRHSSHGHLPKNIQLEHSIDLEEPDPTKEHIKTADGKFVYMDEIPDADIGDESPPSSPIVGK